MARPIAVLIVSTLLGAVIIAQQEKPRFEVASIKRNESRRLSDAILPRVQPGGRFRAGNASVDLFTALAEQLDLKLESRRGPVDMLVIDSVQQPTEN